LQPIPLNKILENHAVSVFGDVSFIFFGSGDHTDTVHGTDILTEPAAIAQAAVYDELAVYDLPGSKITNALTCSAGDTGLPVCRFDEFSLIANLGGILKIGATVKTAKTDPLHFIRNVLFAEGPGDETLQFRFLEDALSEFPVHLTKIGPCSSHIRIEKKADIQP
jgi:hypothetical protein